MQSVGEFEYGQADLIGHGAFALVFGGRHKKVCGCTQLINLGLACIHVMSPLCVVFLSNLTVLAMHCLPCLLNYLKYVHLSLHLLSCCIYLLCLLLFHTYIHTYWFT